MHRAKPTFDASNEPHRLDYKVSDRRSIDAESCVIVILLVLYALGGYVFLWFS
jgi:hypothetical protein